MASLGYALGNMEESLLKLKEQESLYEESEAFREFVSVRTQELEQFKNMVKEFEKCTEVVCVTSHLKRIGADVKFVGMAKCPNEYFQITPKLKVLMLAGY